MQDTLYVGVDAHKERSHVAVIDRGGTVLKSADIPSSRSGVAGELGRYKRPIKAVLEACYAWEPMHDWLDEDRNVRSRSRQAWQRQGRS